MGLNDDLEILRQTPLFADLDAEAVRLIAFGSEQVEVSKGNTLYNQGDVAECAFVLASGTLEMWTQFEDKEPVSHGKLDVGALLGEIALISASDRQFTITAVEDSRLIRINRTQFHRLIGEYPKIADILKGRFESNLARLTGSITDVGDYIANLPR